MNAKNFDPKKLEQTPVTDANATEKRPINAVDFTPDHEMMINDLLALRTHQNFLEAIYEWGEEKGWLTEAQDAKLKEIYDDH